MTTFCDCLKLLTSVFSDTSKLTRAILSDLRSDRESIHEAFRQTNIERDVHSISAKQTDIELRVMQLESDLRSDRESIDEPFRQTRLTNIERDVDSISTKQTAIDLRVVQLESDLRLLRSQVDPILSDSDSLHRATEAISNQRTELNALKESVIRLDCIQLFTPAGASLSGGIIAYLTQRKCL